MTNSVTVAKQSCNLQRNMALYYVRYLTAKTYKDISKFNWFCLENRQCNPHIWNFYKTRISHARKQQYSSRQHKMPPWRPSYTTPHGYVIILQYLPEKRDILSKFQSIVAQHVLYTRTLKNIFKRRKNISQEISLD